MVEKLQWKSPRELVDIVMGQARKGGLLVL